MYLIQGKIALPLKLAVSSLTPHIREEGLFRYLIQKKIALPLKLAVSSLTPHIREEGLFRYLS